MHDGLLWVFLLNFEIFAENLFRELFINFFREFYYALVRADSGIMDAKTITDLIMHLWPST